jgi:hypothetical protein
VLSVLFVMPNWARHFRRRGPLRLSQPGSRPSVGISLWLDELASRAASGYMATLATGFVRFLGFLFPIVATPLFTTQLGG